MGRKEGFSFKRKNQQNFNKDGWKKQKFRKEEGTKPYVKKEFVPKVHLREDQIGITEFVRSGPGFMGVLKSRYSDFHVNEIDSNGKMLQLTDLSVPRPVEETISTEDVDEVRKELGEIITADLWTEISTLATIKSNDEKEIRDIEIEVTSLDKEKRTQVHKMLKKLYGGKLVSTTVNVAAVGNDVERRFIKIMKTKGGRDQNRNKWDFPGIYVHFLVHKENMDTSEVAIAIADRIKLRPSQVNYCGTKDKRAKTTQKFCVKHRTPAQIWSSVKSLPKVHIGNFEFSDKVLKLGDLKGNRFRIALRHVSNEHAQIEAALQSVRQNGFINYYGLQRFGNCAAVPTYEVGIALLKSDFKLACELILKPRENDLPFMKSIRETWWKERNSAAAAALFRSDKYIEKKILDGLAQYGENDYASALRKIPRNNLLLYPHAFQSRIFNCIASRRIKEFGLKLIEGDLVYRNKDELGTDTVEILDVGILDDECEEETIEDIDNSINSTAESVFKSKVKPLTAEDIDSGNYTLFDVVLPLPGYDITYPENVVGEWYTELLQEYDLTSEKLRHNVKTYSLPGAYRSLVIQPTQMSWHFRNYESAESTLIYSDWEMLNQKDKKIAKASQTADGKFKALILDFCLPTAVYATMMLRELLKSDTSTAHQMQLEQSEVKRVAAEELGDSKVKIETK